MASIPLNCIDLTEEEFRPFFEALTAFMKERIRPEWLGVKFIKFRAELEKKGGFDIVADTNKALNNASAAQLRYLIQGFQGGWKAHKE